MSLTIGKSRTLLHLPHLLHLWFVREVPTQVWPGVLLDLQVEGLQCPPLSCVVDAKLTSVTGWFCVCSALDSELSIGCSMIFTGVGFLMMDPLVPCEPCSESNACVWDTWVNCALGEMHGIFSIGQKAVAVVSRVMDPLGVGRFIMFDMVFPSLYISDSSSALLTEFTLSCASDVKYSGLFCSKADWLGWHSG